MAVVDGSGTAGVVAVGSGALVSVAPGPVAFVSVVVLFFFLKRALILSSGDSIVTKSQSVCAMAAAGGVLREAEVIGHLRDMLGELDFGIVV